MILAHLIEEMMVGESGEFETLNILLPVDVSVAVRDLAFKLGIPASRLLAELISHGVTEASIEWRRLTESRPELEPDFGAPRLSLRLPPRVK